MTTKLQRRQSLSAQLISELREMIANKTFAPGDKMPSENELIERYAVSRTVVREAISGLKADGIVETRQGVGAFVTGHSGNRLKPFDPKDLEDVLHILTLRLALEPEVAALAAVNRTKDDLVHLKEKFDELSAHALDAKSFVHPDFKFHLAIAYASHNPYFIQLEEHLGAKIIPHSKLHVLAPDIPEDLNFLKQVQVDHANIYQAIVDGDGKRARAAMKSHLTRSKKLYTEYHESRQSKE